ncbi:MAG: response regulator [Polyangiaceae bacterium]
MEETAAGARRQGSGARVLVVIPDPQLREEVTRTLSERYTVEAVADGRTAMELSLASPPAAILSELSLPVLDALSFLRRLRNDPRTVVVPVIITSRTIVESAISVALATGAADFLAQPFKPGELFARLSTHIDRASQRQMQNVTRPTLSPIGGRESLEQTIMVLDTLLMNAPVGFCFFDLEGRYLRVNHTLAELDGFSVESHIGKRFPEILIPAIAENVCAAFNHVVKHGTPVVNVTREYTNWPGDGGGTRHITSSYYPVRLKGEIFGVGVLVHDLTEQRRAERELDASRSRLGEILESMPEGFLLLDGEGRCRYVNRAAQSVLPGKRTDLIGRPATEVFVLDPPLDRQLQNARGTGTSVRAECYSRATKRWFESFVYPSEDLAAFSIFLRDVTEKRAGQREREALGAKEKAARDEAKAARTFAESATLAKDQFLAAISHELRAPLAAIGMWAQVLLAGKVDEGTVTRGLEAIRASASAQSLLIEDLIDHTRTASQTFKLDTHPLDLVPLLERAIESIRPSAAAKKILLSSNVAGARCLVAGDTDRLHQVFVNLLSNACKFTPLKGRITVTITQKKSRAEVVIRDNGQGIRKDFLPHIFEPFRQADDSTTRAHGGLGLGLAIASHITLLHRGKIQAASEGDGKGSRFTVTLPLLAEQRRSLATGKKKRRPSDEPVLTGVRILVVDDDARQREALSALLTRYGARVTIAKSSNDALRKLTKQKVDVLLSDLAMPTEDGFALIRKVRALEGKTGQNVLAAALTGRIDPREVTQALLAGFQVHLPKTLDPSDLVSAVHALVTSRPPPP